MAFVAGTVAGATLGAVPLVAGYFQRIREVCDRHGVLLILDEVMSGMGRCGPRWALEPEGVVPDLVTLAKGLGRGGVSAGMASSGASSSCRTGRQSARSTRPGASLPG